MIAANPRTVVVLMSAGPLTVPWLKEHAPAMLQAWWLGDEGGDAIADVIFGDANPAGRLPYTVYASEAQVPPQDEYDITKGFTYMYVKGEPLYPFGYGLSYTQFNYSNLRVSPGRLPASGMVTVSVDVKNTGNRAGDEVVQLYTHAVKSSVIRPAKELRGFQRISLQPGEKKSVTFTVPAAKLAYYDVGKPRLRGGTGRIRDDGRQFVLRHPRRAQHRSRTLMVQNAITLMSNAPRSHRWPMGAGPSRRRISRRESRHRRNIAGRVPNQRMGRLRRRARGGGQCRTPHCARRHRTRSRNFLTRFAARIEERAAEIVEMAHLETGLPKSPRLAEVELPRTTGQLRQAAAAANEGSWALPAIDTKLNLRSLFRADWPGRVFGPNNFPFAYQLRCGRRFRGGTRRGQSGHRQGPPVPSRHNTPAGHRGGCWRCARAACRSPPCKCSIILATRMACASSGDRRLAAFAFTGSRAAGLKPESRRRCRRQAGLPRDVEPEPCRRSCRGRSKSGARRLLGNSPPVASLHPARCAQSLASSCYSQGAEAGAFIAAVKQKFEAAPSRPVALRRPWPAPCARASTHCKRPARGSLRARRAPDAPGHRFANTLLSVSGRQFLAEPEKLQTEAFGNASLCVIVDGADQAAAVLAHFDGNLTGSIYSDTRGADDALYARLAPLLRARVGRLLNDKMPTGVAVSPAMNHGGPFPATGHPGFTAVGIPASLRRFAMLACYDNVRPSRLPAMLRDQGPRSRPWRLIDGNWTQGNTGSSA